MSDFRWTQRREEAALLVAQDHLTDEQIAARMGVSRQALQKLKRHAPFRERVESLVADMRAAIKARGIAEKQNRINAYNDRWERMHAVIKARAERNGDLTGGDTGLVVREVTYLPGGGTRERHEVDTGLLKELREHEKQAAQELGDWTERVEQHGDLTVRYVNDWRNPGET